MVIVPVQMGDQKARLSVFRPTPGWLSGGLRCGRQSGQEGPEIVRQNDGALSEFLCFQTTTGDRFVDFRSANATGCGNFRDVERLALNVLVNCGHLGLLHAVHVSRYEHQGDRCRPTFIGGGYFLWIFLSLTATQSRASVKRASFEGGRCFISASRNRLSKPPIE